MAEQLEGASWEQLGAQLAWIAAAQLGLVLLSALLSPAIALLEASEVWMTFKLKWIGNFEQPASQVWLSNIIGTCQMAVSILIVSAWVYATYAPRSSTADGRHPILLYIELVSCSFFIFTYVREHLRYGFSFKHAWSLQSILDVICVVSLLVAAGGTFFPEPTWLSLTYLRALRVQMMWGEFDKSGALDNFGQMPRAIVESVIKFSVIVILFSGTMFIFEALGDPEVLVDQTLETRMGPSSFFIQAYFTFVTISTVGYGDYSPSSVLGRLWVFIMIVGGVIFFGSETSNISEVYALLSSGKGRFSPKSPAKKHVLVIGGGVLGSISVLESFLASLVDSSHGSKVPEVVIVAMSPPSTEMKAMLESAWAMGNITYLNGNPTTHADLERARIDNVEMCFVLADIAADVPLNEDMNNISRAAVIYRWYGTPMLLLLLEAKNASFASQAGIPSRFVKGFDDMEETIISSSARCVGLSTLALNLALQDITVAGEVPESERWLLEYLEGANKELYGLQLAAEYTGLAFTAAARKVYAEFGVIMIACQDDSLGRGQVVMNPGSACTLREATVVFVIAASEKATDPIRRHRGREWLHAYEQNAAAALERDKAEMQSSAALALRPSLLALSSKDRKALSRGGGGDGDEMKTLREVGGGSSGVAGGGWSDVQKELKFNESVLKRSVPAAAGSDGERCAAGAWVGASYVTESEEEGDKNGGETGHLPEEEGGEGGEERGRSLTRREKMERLSRKLSMSPDKVLCSSRGTRLRSRDARHAGGAATAREGKGAETARTSAVASMATARTSVTVPAAPAARMITQREFGMSLSPRSPRGMALASMFYEADLEDDDVAEAMEDDGTAPLFEREPTVSDPALMREILRHGNHIVVMGLRGYVLQPLLRIILTLTSEHLPARFRQVPIVILYYTENPLASDKALKMLRGCCSSLVFVNARPLKLESLLLAGVDRCSKLIVMSGPSDGNMMERCRHEPLLMDGDLILLLNLLDSQSKLYWGSLPTLIFSLEVPQNATLIAEGMEEEEMEAQATRPQKSKQDEGKDRVLEQGDRSTLSAKAVRTHLKYASGQLIPRPFLCSLFAANYHNPAVLDLIQSMTRAVPDGRTSSVWKIPLSPASAGGGISFDKLFQEFIESDAIPIGIYRKAGGVSSDGSDTSLGNHSPVVVTCPPANAMVQSGDEIYVIATSDFYSQHMQQMSQLDTFTPRPTTRSRTTLSISTARQTSPTTPARPRTEASADMPPLAANQEAAAGSYSTHCPRGHMLKVIITPLEGWGCDVCKTKGLSKGTKMWGCRKCRWVSCSACRKKNPDPQLLQLCMTSRRKRRSSRERGTGAKTVRTLGGSSRDA